MGNFLNKEPNLKFKKYGWKRDLPDHRDQFKIYNDFTEQSYVKVNDLRNKCPPIYDQGKLGSCTANAIAGAFEYNDLKKYPDNPVMPSRLFIYYNERYMENTVNTDSGASIRDGMKTLNYNGVCPEIEWPYDIEYFNVCPSKFCYELAYQYRSIEYKRVKQELDQLKKCIDDDYLIICGISIFDSFESDNVGETGYVPIPKSNESFLGGHAVLLVGYDDNNEHFILRNSWGEHWGEKGYGYIPYDYILNENLSSDFWIIEKIIESDDRDQFNSNSDSDCNLDSESNNSDNDDNDDNDNNDDNDDNDDNDNDDNDDNDNDDNDNDNDDEIDNQSDSKKNTKESTDKNEAMKTDN